MKWHSLSSLVVAASLCLGVSTAASTAALAEEAASTAAPKPVDLGKLEYESKCASCHGMAGKGDGPTAGFLTRKASDLTVLAKNNNGILPVAAMYDIIVGKNVVPVHGTRDMPIWGRVYNVQAANYFFDVPYNSEAYVRARVLALIEYINRLQAK